MIGLAALLGKLHDLTEAVHATPTYRWGTITTAAPLRVRLDGETSPIDGEPDSLARPATGDRVLVLLHRRRAIILGSPQTDPTPPGVIAPYGGATAPHGWLLCDGSSYQRADYPALAAVIGAHYGGTATQFSVPNLQERVPVGRRPGSRHHPHLGTTGGEAEHRLTAAELPAHSHQLTSGGQTFRYITAAPPSGNAFGGLHSGRGADLRTSAVGANLAHNNLQPFVTVNYIIRH